MRVIVPFDSIPELPPGYDKYQNIYYDLVLIDIKSGEENSKIDFEERQKYNAILMETDSIAKLVLEDYRAGKLNDQIIEKPSGLKIYIHEQGSGPKPQKGLQIPMVLSTPLQGCHLAFAACWYDHWYDGAGKSRSPTYN